LISSPNVVNKNCVIFPEKINGKFVVIHRVFPNMLIDFVDDLSFEEKYLEGHYKIPPRYDSWDSRKLGAGAPPIKTKDGWLLIYQAVDDKDPSKYKIGAMLLDLQDPTKVLYRSHKPILEPTEWYENEGFKSGVAYPCGAVIMNDRLMVYYGGADTVMCAASSPLDVFLKKLKQSGAVKKEEKVYPQKVQYLYAN
jgi:beta-1,2-mannobiose phosphorylase / 1,2-beta-oligomannan phosphorylase